MLNTPPVSRSRMRYEEQINLFAVALPKRSVVADKIPKAISNATVIKVLAKVFAFQAIEINLLRSHAGISDANWKALKTEAFKKTYAKQRSFYEDRLTGAFALERISQSERETRLLELWLKQSEDSPKDEA
jgi:hypothetical protein